MKKEEILNILADEPQMETLKVLQYNTLIKVMIDQKLNTQRYSAGYTAQNLKYIKYDMQKHFGIMDIEITRKKMNLVDQENEDQELKNIDVEFEKVVGEVLPDVEERTKMRADFPFLNDKDCPDALKILVADRITAFNHYKKAHQTMIDFKEKKVELSDEEQASIAENMLRDYEENRLIFEELDHYQANKQILGKHPIFEDLVLSREVEAMTPDEKQSLLSSNANYMKDQRKGITNAKGDEEKIAVFQERINIREKKLALVKASLGLTK